MSALRRGLVLGLTCVLVLSLAAPAMGNIFVLPDPAVFSPGNPGAIDQYESTWREGWGNEPFPHFIIQVPPADDGQPSIVGGLYLISRPESSRPATISLWPQMYNAPISSSGPWNLKLDIVGETLNPGPLFGPNIPPVGAERPYEGLYSVSYQFFAQNTVFSRGGAAASNIFDFGLDMTPPDRVTGLKAYAGYGLEPVTGVLKQGRVHLRWDDKTYDRLSGTGYFEALLDGKPFPIEDAEGKPVTDDETKTHRVYDLQEHFDKSAYLSVATPREMTIEKLPAGRHTLQVRAVDRATNEGPLSAAVTLDVDPDFPTVDITWPKESGQVVGAYSLFSADVTDLGGVAWVKFYVDGKELGTDDSAPYAAVLDLSQFAQGSLHTLKVLAQDKAGRQNFAEKDFRIDLTAPRLTNVTTSASVFYPRLRDGYKDNYTVKFAASEPATATLTIKNSKGKIVRTISKGVATGSSSIVWNGKPTTGEVAAGAYSWSLRLTDLAGNRSSAVTGSCSIRFYEIVKTSLNKVRVVPR